MELLQNGDQCVNGEELRQGKCHQTEHLFVVFQLDMQTGIEPFQQGNYCQVQQYYRHGSEKIIPLRPALCGCNNLGIVYPEHCIYSAGKQNNRNICCGENDEIYHCIKTAYQNGFLRIRCQIKDEEYAPVQERVKLFVFVRIQ